MSLLTAHTGAAPEDDQVHDMFGKEETVYLQHCNLHQNELRDRVPVGRLYKKNMRSADTDKSMQLIEKLGAIKTCKHTAEAEAQYDDHLGAKIPDVP